MQHDKQLDAQLKHTVHELGKLIGQTIKHELAQEWLDKIEAIRLQGRAGHLGYAHANIALQKVLKDMNNKSLMVIPRALAQFLNLANIAEQEFNSSKQLDDSVDVLFSHLRKDQKSTEAIYEAVNALHSDLVLTAHPTEVTRRTMIHKHTALAECLRQQHNDTLYPAQKLQLSERIADLVEQAWHTEEIRDRRPTPIDEATWGFSVIENSLWDAIPDFMRDLDLKLQQEYDIKLPIDAQPIQISAWMGGDRDGNPFVTSKVTQTVLHLARRRATKLFAKDISALQVELSMNKCDATIRNQVGSASEPYRAILKPLVKRLRATKDGIDDLLNGRIADDSNWIHSQKELLKTLMQCYRSLISCGLEQTAKGGLLDTIAQPTLISGLCIKN